MFCDIASKDIASDWETFMIEYNSVSRSTESAFACFALKESDFTLPHSSPLDPFYVFLYSEFVFIMIDWTEQSSFQSSTHFIWMNFFLFIFSFNPVANRLGLRTVLYEKYIEAFVLYEKDLDEVQSHYESNKVITWWKIYRQWDTTPYIIQDNSYWFCLHTLEWQEKNKTQRSIVPAKYPLYIHP